MAIDIGAVQTGGLDIGTVQSLASGIEYAPSSLKASAYISTATITIAHRANEDDAVGFCAPFGTFGDLILPPRIGALGVDFFLIGGQSNATGYGVTPSTATPLADASFDYLQNTNTTVPIADPTGEGGYASDQGSAWPNFAKVYIEKSQHRVCICKAAVGGTAQTSALVSPSANHWEGGTYYLDSVSFANEAILYLRNQGYNVNFRGILWCQGETDGNGIFSATITKAQYKTALESMIADYRAEYTGIEIFISRIGNGNSGWTEVRAAQDEVAAALSYVHIWDGATSFSGDLHYSTAEYDIMGEALANLVITANPTGIFYPKL